MIYRWGDASSKGQIVIETCHEILVQVQVGFFCTRRRLDFKINQTECNGALKLDPIISFKNKVARA